MYESEVDSLLPPPGAWNRRALMRSALGTGFAVAVLPICAQTVVKTDFEGLIAGEVMVPVGNEKIPVYRAAPAGRSGLPVVLVASEIFGVHEHIADVARRFAKAGFYAIAPELFVRQGEPGSYGEIAKLMSEIIAKTPDAQVMADLDACVAWAGTQGADAARVGITGFCWGGRTTLMYAAHNPRLKAAVAWYGPIARAYEAGDRSVLEVAGRIKAPVLGLYGGADAGIPSADVEKLRAALRAGGNTAADFVIYPDTPHGFNADYRPTYRRQAAEDGWRRCLAWFRANGLV